MAFVLVVALYLVGLLRWCVFGVLFAVLYCLLAAFVGLVGVVLVSRIGGRFVLFAVVLGFWVMMVLVCVC